MQFNHSNPTTNRRGFLGTLAMGMAAMGIGFSSLPVKVAAEPEKLPLPPDDPESWFNKINGKHRMVFDVTGPHEMLPFVWPRVFMMTNAMTGTPEKNCSEVIVLRSKAIPYAMEDRLWEKYKFGEFFKIEDPVTKAPSVRNMFWMPKPGDLAVPGMGNVQIGINELQDSGAMFCVCNNALSASGNILAKRLDMDASEVHKDFLSGILPGIQVVPSGVWAVGRAQEHGCCYCFVE